MTTQEVKKSYVSLDNQEPVLNNCFFAFTKKQMEEGIAKFNLQGQKIYNGQNGLYGTKEGIKEVYDFYDNIRKEITENCNPQEVYDLEYSNHECSYTHNDYEAIKITLSYFDIEKVKLVKRKNKRVELESISFND